MLLPDDVGVKVSPRDYARNNRRWRGEIPIASFDRLAREIAADSKSVEVELVFSRDENDRIRMQGQASVTADVACHRCAESVETTIQADIDARIVRSEDTARQLAQESDVIVVQDNPVAVSDLIEDDLIMSIPWRVCEDREDCPNQDVEITDESQDEDRGVSSQRPFANLRELLDR